eukprot:749514-Hanusia_phi.AAC.2
MSEQELPLELRSFGAPPEYTEAIRSPHGNEFSGGAFGLNTLKEGDASFSSLPGSSRKSLHDSPSKYARDDTGASGEDVDQEQRSNLSEAVIRKLKQKTSHVMNSLTLISWKLADGVGHKLEKELRDKKRQLEDMMKSVVSWKNSIKDKHISKIEEVETVMKQKLHKSHITSRKLKVKLITEILRKRAALTKASVLNFWHEIAIAGRIKAKLKDAEDRYSRQVRGERVLRHVVRCASSELMVAFLKEQLNSTGMAPRSMPKPNSASEEELVKANVVLESLLSQIPTGSVSEYDASIADAAASSSQVRGSLTSQLEMMWAEVRELVAKSANQQGLSRASSSGISNELVIARLRGKLDHMSKMLEAKDSELEECRAQLQLKVGGEGARTGQGNRLDMVAAVSFDVRGAQQGGRLNHAPHHPGADDCGFRPGCSCQRQDQGARAAACEDLSRYGREGQSAEAAGGARQYRVVVQSHPLISLASGGSHQQSCCRAAVQGV